MQKLFSAHHIRILSILHVVSECPEGKSILYPGYLQHYELIFTLSGVCGVTFQGKTGKEQAGSIRYLPRHVRNNTYQVDNIESGECFDIFFDTDSPLPEAYFIADFADNATLPRLFQRAYSLWSRRNPGWYNECLSVFYAILAEMERAAAVRVPYAHRAKLEHAMEHLHAHYCDASFQLSELAAISGVSYTYFKRLFEEAYGVAPSVYVKSLRISRACELLETGRFSVTQVAEMCGYSSVYYFSRVFRETMHTPPGRFSRRTP